MQGRIQGVCLAVMTDPFILQVGYSALKPMIKYQTLSLQVSNACGLEQTKAYISLITLHSTIMKQQCPCLRALSKWHLCNDMKQHSRLRTLQIDIASNAGVSEFLPLAVPTPIKQSCQKLVHCHTHAELFCNISLHGKRTQCPIAITLFCSFGLNFFCSLQLLVYH